MAWDSEIDPELHTGPDRAETGAGAGINHHVALATPGADTEFGAADR
jgi:hypothetical protein